MVILGLWSLKRRIREVKYHFHQTLSKIHELSLLILVLSTWWRQCFSCFCIERLLSLSSPSYSLLWKEATMCSPHGRSGELCLTSLRAQYLHILFGILPYRRFVYSPNLFIYSFVHLFISIWTHEYSFFTLSYNLILLYFVVKLFQLWLLGALSVGSYVSDLLPSMCGFFFSFLFEHFLTFWHYKVL